MLRDKLIDPDEHPKRYSSVCGQAAAQKYGQLTTHHHRLKTLFNPLRLLFNSWMAADKVLMKSPYHNKISLSLLM